MRPILLRILAVAMLMSPVAYAQSLGDIARENREKQNAEDASAAKPRVITNANLPKDPDANQPSHEQGSQEQGSREAPPPIVRWIVLLRIARLRSAVSRRSASRNNMRPTNGRDRS